MELYFCLFKKKKFNLCCQLENRNRYYFSYFLSKITMEKKAKGAGKVFTGISLVVL